MDDVERTQRTRAPRWMRIAFGVSLALNLAVVGVLAGTFARFGGPPSRGPGMISYATPYVRALPRDDQREIFRAVRDQLPKDSNSRQARRVRPCTGGDNPEPAEHRSSCRAICGAHRVAGPCCGHVTRGPCGLCR